MAYNSPFWANFTRFFDCAGQNDLNRPLKGRFWSISWKGQNRGPHLRKPKNAILARPQLGHGDLPRPQICAVDFFRRLLPVCKFSAQTDQIARKYGPLKNAIFGFFEISTEIGSKLTSVKTDSRAFSRGLLGSKLLPIDSKLDFGVLRKIGKNFYFSRFWPFLPCSYHKKLDFG